MANINDDTSVGRDSVFDWGSSGSSKVRLSSIEGTKTNINNSDAEAPTSRYDPTAMSRIVDITDLVDDSDDEGDDNIIGNSSSMPHTMHIGTAGSKRSSSSFLGLVGLIILAAIVCVVGFGYVNNQRSSTVSSAYLLVDDEDGQQEKLEMAERVITACGSEGINKECQSLCKSKLCCFDDGEYGCQGDDSKDCATYAGCIALVEGTVVGGAEEDEE